jgi:hypothetical protein
MDLKVATVGVTTDRLPEGSPYDFVDVSWDEIDSVVDYTVVIVESMEWTEQLVHCLDIIPPDRIHELLLIAPELSTEQKLQAQEFGVTHWLEPETANKEIIAGILEDFERINSELKQKDQFAQEAMNTAMTAMTSSAELGKVIHFMRQSFTEPTIEGVIDLLMQTITEYSMRCCLQVRLDEGEINESSSGSVSGMEAQIMSSMVTAAAIVSHGTRTLFTYGRLTVFIKNMPVEDEELCGRMRDNLALLVEGAASRIEAILVDVNMEHKTETLNRAIQLVRSTLEDYRSAQTIRKKQSKEILENLLVEMEVVFQKLDMSLEAEESILSLSTESVDKVSELFLADTGTDRYLEFLLQQISRSDRA